MKFRKKPVVIDAEQWAPGIRIEGVLEKGDAGWPTKMPNIHFTESDTPADMGYIHTLEGGHFVTAGDWIITGVRGEKYPCKPEIFEATYEPA